MSTYIPELPNLHDAQLFDIRMDWSAKNLSLRVRHGWPPAWSDLVFDDVQSVSLTRQDAWGPSAHILGMKAQATKDAFRFAIEMQSGDVIDCVASSWQLVPAKC